MSADIIEVTSQPNFHLWLKFEDGIEGEVNIAKMVAFTGVFEPLQEVAFFNQVFIENGTVAWANGADLDPLVLYAEATGKPLPQYATAVIEES